MRTAISALLAAMTLLKGLIGLGSGRGDDSLSLLSSLSASSTLSGDEATPSEDLPAKAGLWMDLDDEGWKLLANGLALAASSASPYTAVLLIFIWYQ